MIGHILLTLAVLAVTGFVLLVLIGLWDRYERETAALGFGGIYERHLASQAEAQRAREQLAPAQFFQQGRKLLGTGAVGSTNQGMSVALSADGNTAIVGGPGANNADRDQSPFVGPAGAAWVFTRSGGVWTQQGNKLVGTTSEYGGDCGPKVRPWLCPPTATLPWWAGLATIGRRGPHRTRRSQVPARSQPCPYIPPIYLICRGKPIPAGDGARSGGPRLPQRPSVFRYAMRASI
jgi:hypothetical protein